MKNTFLLALLVALLASCNNSPQQQQAPQEETLSEEAQEAREDSIALVKAYEAQSKIQLAIPTQAETQVMDAKSTDDAADDPAIWVHPKDASKSLIYGSNKKGGLAVYDLQGKEIEFYPLGKINNVDILSDFQLGGKKVQLLGCSNRTLQSIDLFVIDENTGKLTNIAKDKFKMDTQQIDDVYGFCFATEKKSKKHYALVNGKNGMMHQFELKANKGKVELELKRAMKFDTQTEGMAADTEYNTLYVGEENVGVWKLSIDPTDNKKTFIESSSTQRNPNIKADVEGITIYKDGKEGFLIVSSQGNFSYAMFERQGDNKYLGSFKVVASEGVDGVEETDGLDVVNANLGDLYPKGLIVFQDGFNYDGDTLVPQNFKLVSMEALLAAMK